jgi:CO/xanthine dehydrogenase FAD-binding subunit
MVTFYRRLPKFDLVAPGTLDEALRLLLRHQGKAKIIAGGTDLIPKLRGRQIAGPEFLIDLRKIPNLNFIECDERLLHIGALTTLRTIETSSIIREKFNLLFQAAQSVGSIQVRNRGTIAGNICNAVPSADLAPALLVLEARLRLAGSKGQRTVGIGDFFVGPNKTVLSAGEVLTEIQIPNLPHHAKALYLKLSPRSAMDLAVVGVAVLTNLEQGLCREVRIALGAVAPTPIRASRAEKIMQGQKVSPELIEQTAQAAAGESRPIDDHRASAEYRREMVKVLTRRALTLTTSD